LFFDLSNPGPPHILHTLLQSCVGYVDALGPKDPIKTIGGAGWPGPIYRPGGGSP
jgi:hypothetical protein